MDQVKNTINLQNFSAGNQNSFVSIQENGTIGRKHVVPYASPKLTPKHTRSVKQSKKKTKTHDSPHLEFPPPPVFPPPELYDLSDEYSADLIENDDPHCKTDYSLNYGLAGFRTNGEDQPPEGFWNSPVEAPWIYFLNNGEKNARTIQDNKKREESTVEKVTDLDVQNEFWDVQNPGEGWIRKNIESSTPYTERKSRVKKKIKKNVAKEELDLVSDEIMLINKLKEGFNEEEGEPRKLEGFHNEIWVSSPTEDVKPFESTQATSTTHIKKNHISNVLITHENEEILDNFIENKPIHKKVSDVEADNQHEAQETVGSSGLHVRSGKSNKSENSDDKYKESNMTVVSSFPCTHLDFRCSAGAENKPQGTSLADFMSNAPDEYSYAYYEPGPVNKVIRNQNRKYEYDRNARHTYTTRYGTEENIYEEITEVSYSLKNRLSDPKSRKKSDYGPAHFRHASLDFGPNQKGSRGSSRKSHSQMSLNQSIVEEEVKEVQSTHRRVLGQLNLTMEEMLMPNALKEKDEVKDELGLKEEDRTADDNHVTQITDLDSGFSGSSGTSASIYGGSNYVRSSTMFRRPDLARSFLTTASKIYPQVPFKFKHNNEMIDYRSGDCCPDRCTFQNQYQFNERLIRRTASTAKGIIIFIDALTNHNISDILQSVTLTDFRNVFPYFDFFSLGIIVLILIFILFGLRNFKSINKIFTVCNVTLIGFAIIAGTVKADVKNWQIGENPESGFAPFGALGVIKGAALAFYGFIGFDAVGVSGTEVKKQKRNLPAAILVTILVTLVVHAGVGVILTLLLPYYKLSPHVALVFVFQDMGWTTLKWMTAVGSFCGFQTSLFGAIFPLPRIIQDMANDGLLFSFLGNSHSTSKIPVAASVTGGLSAALAAGFFSFQELVNLTIVGALFVCTILAINVILLRYSPKFGDEELSGSWSNLINTNSDVTMKAIMQNYFNFKGKHPTNLTVIITIGNVILFCVASIGLSTVFNFFYDGVVKCSVDVIISAGVLLCILIFSFTSIACQPKSQGVLPFKVPLVPFAPCLGIFLNVFLIVACGPLTWSLLAIWMAAGILPHLGWILLKWLRGEKRENSLYEINKSNCVKLNEWIWKIKLEKKSLCEGAINPTFSDEIENRFIEVEADRDGEAKHESLHLKQPDIADIQLAEFAVEEKLEPLGRHLEVNFIPDNSEKNVNVLTEEEENVHWECVAEIHTEEEIPLESIALEIVDNTYNFLTEVSEELSKDDAINILTKTKRTFNKIENPEKQPDLPGSLLDDSNKENGKSVFDEFSKKQTAINSDENHNKEQIVNLILENVHETHNGEMILNSNDTIAVEAVKSVPDELNKIKRFKEKLNQLLKNQINSNIHRSINSSLLKSLGASDVSDDQNNEQNNASTNNTKTLNKSQIKGKLELLLAKGPPKRVSLSDSFNIKIKDEGKDSKVEKGENQIQKIKANVNVSNGEKHLIRSSPGLADSIKEKILSLKGVTTADC